MLKFKSKVGKGSSKFDSARLILPQGLRQILDINPGDKVEWIVNINNDDVEVKFKKLEDQN